MKRILLASASALLLLSSCGPSKEDVKKKIVKSCIEGAKSEMGDTSGMPQMDALMAEYCNCAGDKTVNTLSSAELKELDKNPDAINSPEMKKKLEPAIQPCMDDMMNKLQSSLGNMQPQSQPMTPTP